MMDVVSFDVFDTLLTRVVGTPTSAFILLGKVLVDRVIINESPTAFARKRVEAEVRAREKSEGSEVTLRMIYLELAQMLPLTATEMETAMQVECEIEDLLIRAVPDAERRILAERQCDARIIFMSDMYLPAPLIIRWLEQHGLWHQQDRLYLSNEERVSKATGKLFRRVLQSECLKPSQLTHYGNNRYSDVASALREGIKSRPFGGTDLQRYEKLMEAEVRSTGGLSSVMAGASRLARLSVPAVTEAQKTLRDTTTGVIAPTLAAYVIWILRRAQALSLQRLYFVSRDGQILLEIARRVAPKLGIECELRYLYSSRQSWHLPAILTLEESKLEWIFKKYESLSIEGILFRIGITPDEVATELAGAGFCQEDWRRQLKDAEIERLKPLILRGRVHDLILARAQAKRRTLLGYLRQEGLLDGTRWALVDLGWNGRPQASLGEILRSVNGPSPHGFYFGLSTRPAERSAGTFDAYMFDPDNIAYREALSDVNVYTLLEIACTADHGTVDTFIETESGYGPLFRTERNQLALDWGLPLMQKTVCSFADHLLLNESLMDLSVDMRPTLIAIMKAFWKQPTRVEALVWGAFHFEKDQSSSSIHPIVKVFTIRTLCRALLNRRLPPSLWRQGSISVSSLPIRLILRLGSSLASVKRRLDFEGKEDLAPPNRPISRRAFVRRLAARFRHISP